MNLAESVLVVTLAGNAALVFGYRVYRLTRGGPMADAVGGAALGLVLAAVAMGVAADIGWAPVVAAGYGLVFAIAVMPVWVLGVLIPMRPGRVDYAFTVLYWASLLAIAVAAVAA